MKGIVGVIDADVGSMSTASPGLEAAYLPQQSELDRAFPARVLDLVSLGLFPRRGLLGRHRRGRSRRGVGRDRGRRPRGFEKRPIDTLSGGQLQRALFARVIVAGRPAHPARRAVQRRRRQDLGDLIAIIQRWHGEGRTVSSSFTTSTWCAAFSRDAASGAPCRRLGPDAAALSPENLVTAPATSTRPGRPMRPGARPNGAASCRRPAVCPRRSAVRQADRPCTRR